LVFKGRKKRFIKLGGEMISLPAIETILFDFFASESDDGPMLAVESTPDENKPEIVLFSVKDLDREKVNEQIKAGGLSALHNIRQIIKIDTIPVLGTGKTDYKKLKLILKGE
jgi:long-chain-fatty-acid--[acyl-carrier-protein] ligase